MDTETLLEPINNDSIPTINTRIKERRLQLGLTLLDIANYLGVRDATVQRYESGAIKNISHTTLCKLSKILRCSPSYLTGWNDNSMTAISRERIKIRRKELHLTADDVADAIGVSRATIYRYESATIEKLPTELLQPLSKVLRCSPAYLMGWEDEAPAAINFTLSPLEIELLERFRSMSTAEKNLILRSMGLPEISGHKETPSAEDC